MMNYIQEINAFYARVETNPVSGSAANLWHTLMHVNNRAHWVKEFTVAASVLCGKSGLAPSTFKRARTELKEKGYIKVTSRGTKAPMYQIVSLSSGVVEVGEEEREREEEVREEDQTLVRATTQASSQVVDQDANRAVGPLIKQDNKQQTKTISSTASIPEYILEFFNDHFGKVTNYIKSELGCWVDQLGEELVFEALKRTVENGKSTWRYTLGILHKWKKDGLRTIADVEAAEEAFRQGRTAPQEKVRHGGYEDASRKLFYGGNPGRYTPHRQQREEVIPDWFRELKAEKGLSV